jgi:type III secretion protein R
MIVGGGANPYTLIGVMCLVGVVPLLVGFATAYLKLSIVLGMLRNALGGQQVPGQIVTSALALVLTLVVMEPVILGSLQRVETIDLKALGAHPLREGRLLVERAGEPWREFLLQHTGMRERKTLERLMHLEPKEKVDSPTVLSPEPTLVVLLGGFMLTELREAFVMACVLLVPFVVIDLVIANLLVGLGMFMLSPVMLTLPIKLAAFCAVDGWLLLTEALVRSYRGG